MPSPFDVDTAERNEADALAIVAALDKLDSTSDIDCSEPMEIWEPTPPASPALTRLATVKRLRLAKIQSIEVKLRTFPIRSEASESLDSSRVLEWVVAQLPGKNRQNVIDKTVERTGFVPVEIVRSTRPRMRGIAEHLERLIEAIEEKLAELASTKKIVRGWR